MKKAKEKKSLKENNVIPALEEVVINEYGNSKKIPHGWLTTGAPGFKLDSIGVRHIKAVKSWPGNIFTKRYPVIVTCYHPDDNAKVAEAEKSGKLVPTYQEAKEHKLGGYDGVPYGWEVSPLTVVQLRKISVAFIRAWITEGRSTKNARCHHPKDRDAVAAYKPKKRSADSTSYRARPIDKYAAYMTDDISMQIEIIYEYDNNKSTRGTAWQNLSWYYQEQDKESMWNIYHRMKSARNRHQRTNYDELRKSGMDRDSANALKTYYPEEDSHDDLMSDD